jgi:hypothetical protein
MALEADCVALFIRISLRTLRLARAGLMLSVSADIVDAMMDVCSRA